jgi:hypothetical protein
MCFCWAKAALHVHATTFVTQATATPPLSNALPADEHLSLDELSAGRALSPGAGAWARIERIRAYPQSDPRAGAPPAAALLRTLAWQQAGMAGRALERGALRCARRLSILFGEPAVGGTELRATEELAMLPSVSERAR